MPAHDVQRNEVRCRDDAAFDGDQLTSLRPSLLRIASLQITGEDDPRIGFPNYFPRVDMAECEIIIALVHEYIHRSRRIGIVTVAACQTGVENADIESTQHRG